MGRDYVSSPMITTHDIQQARRAYQSDNPQPARRLLLSRNWQPIQNPQLLSSLSDLAFEIEETTTAFHILQHILQQNPTEAAPHLRLGQALRRTGRPQEALPYLTDAYQIEPNNEQTGYELALVLEDLQKYEEALKYARLALRQKPDDADLLNIVASNLCNLGRPTEAIPLYVKAIEREPDFHALSFNLSQALLQAGQWAEGWRFFDFRLVLRPPEKRPETNAPLWKGEPLGGKSILIWQEQGFGDTVQFLRFLPVLVDRGTQVTVLLNRQLISLAEANFPDCTFLDQRTTPPTTDFQLPILSLARRLSLNDPNMLTGEAYLSVPQHENSSVSRKLQVGLVWAGNPNHPDDHRRSLPPDELLPLLQLPQITWYSLQVGRHEWAGKHSQVQDLRPELTDFLATAKKINEMDLIISVDTAVGHLAGALGKRIWLLLDYAADWRWGTKEDKTVWYQTMRLFRQPSPGDWAGLVQKVRHTLEKYPR